jgi:hypothetical protein
MDPLDEPKNERTNKRMGLQIEGRQSSKALCRTIGGAGGYFSAAGHAKWSLKALQIKNQIRVPSPGNSIEISRLQPPQIQLKMNPLAGQIMMIVVVVAVAMVMWVTA